MTQRPRRTGNRVAYRLLQAWARRAVTVVYRRVEVSHRDNVPRDRPVILAANHSNALADIAVIVAEVPEFPHFLAAATWWKRAPARVLFRLGGVLPVHRSREGATNSNVSTFAACHEALAERAHLAIFPEGEMHLEPALLPLKTGAARIGLGAVVDAGVPGVQIVPVGLVYEDRGRFRSDAEIRFGEALDMELWADAYRADPAKAVRAVTDALGDAVADVTVNHGSHDEALLVAWAAAMVLADEAASFAARNELRRRLGRRLAADSGSESSESLASSELSSPTDYDQLARTVTRHARDLAALGLDDSSSLAVHDRAERRQLTRQLWVLAPPAALGAITNAPMVLAVGAISRRIPHEAWQATTKGVGGTLLLPIVWATEVALLSRRVRVGTATALVAGGAVCGMVTLDWIDRMQRVRAIRRLDRLAAEQPGEIERGRESRRALRDVIDR